MSERLDYLVQSAEGAKYLLFQRASGGSGTWEADIEVTQGTTFLCISLADETPPYRRASGVELTIESPAQTCGNAFPYIGEVRADDSDPVVQRTNDHGYAFTARSPEIGTWRIRLVAQDPSPFTLRFQTFVVFDDGLNAERRRRHKDARSYPQRSAIALVVNDELVGITDRCAICRRKVAAALNVTGILVLVAIIGPPVAVFFWPPVVVLAGMLANAGVGIKNTEIVDLLQSALPDDLSPDTFTRLVCRVAGECG